MHPLIQSFKAMRLRSRIAYVLFVALGSFLALQGTLWAISSTQAIDVSSALYVSNIQIFNLGITRENFAAATEISGSALIDDAFMEAGTLNAVIHEGPLEIPSMPPNSRILVESALLDDGGSFIDVTTQAQSATELDVPLLPASPQVNDAFYVGCDNPCSILTFDIGQEGVGDWEVEWEYFNGTDFTAPTTSSLSSIDDKTNGFKNAGLRTASFPMPSDFTESAVTGSAVESYYWRARVTSVSESSQQAVGNRIWYENGQWWMWGQSQNINEELLYSLSVGGPDLVTNHQIFTGTQGMTASDSASAELGDTYSVHFSGSVNFTAGTTGSTVCIICKEDAFELYISDSAVTGVSNEITLDLNNGSVILTVDGIPDSVDLPVSTTPHIIDVVDDGTDVTLSVDGIGTDAGTSVTITDNSNNWGFGSNQGFVFADTIYFLPDDTALAFEIFDTETQWDTGTMTDMVSTGGQPGLTLQHLTEASADDGTWWEGSDTFNNSNDFTEFGFSGVSSRTSANSFHRFDNIRIDQGATILSADLVFTPVAANANATVSVDIVAADEDDAAAPTTFAGAEALDRTTAVTNWSPVDAWVVGTLESSPDITNVIQEIVDRPGWANGNAIVILVEDSGSTAVADTLRESCSFEAQCEAVRLQITVDTGVTFTDDFIEMEPTAEDTSNAGFIEDWTQSCSGTGCQSRVFPFGVGSNSKARFGVKSMRIRAGVNVGGNAAVVQRLDASPGQVWSFSTDYAWVDDDDDDAIFFATWVDPAISPISTESVALNTNSDDYQSAVINNVTAPANTAFVEVGARIDCSATCSGSSGVSIDGVMAAQDTLAPSWPDAANELSNSSFEQVYQTTATWDSPTIDLNQSNVASSAISWDSLAPFGGTLLVETSLNGAAFVEATNNDSIPGINDGDDVSGQTLEVRITMTPSSPDDQVFSPFTSLLAVIINDDVLEDSAILFYQLRTTPGVTIEDLSPNANDAILHYPVQLTGIFSALTPLQSTRTPLSQEAAIGAGDFAAGVTGSDTLNLFGEDTGEDFIPFVAPAIEGAQAAGFPTAWLWSIGVMILGVVLGGIVWRFTDGNELLVSIALGGTLILAAALGDGLIPGWVPFVAIIMLTAYNILRSRLPI